MALASFFNRNRKKTGISVSENTQQVQQLPVARIQSNRYQPRKVFRMDSINELAETIDAHGLLQPIIVREYAPKQYEIIAGERRYRAIKKLKWAKVPAIVEKMSDDETAAMALIENLQREELTPIEEASAYQNLLQQNNITQVQLAQAVGKSQSFIANKMRLLKLSDAVKEAIINGEISERHGRALLKLKDINQQIALHKVLHDHLNVKETEDLVRHLLNPEMASDHIGNTATKLAETPIQQKSKNPAVSKPTTKNNHKKPVSQTQSEKIANVSKPTITGHSKDPKLAINTLRQSLKMIQDAGVRVDAEESDEPDSYQLVIKINKKN